MADVATRFFLVERYVPSWSDEALEAATLRLDAECVEGDVGHLLTLVVPAEDTCLSLFQAAGEAAIAAVHRAAELPVDRIAEVRVYRRAALPCS